MQRDIIIVTLLPHTPHYDVESSAQLKCNNSRDFMSQKLEVKSLSSHNILESHTVIAERSDFAESPGQRLRQGRNFQLLYLRYFVLLFDVEYGP